MKLKSLEINKSYKIQKAQEKLRQKMSKRLLSEKLKYDKLKNKQFQKIKAKYDKKLEKRLKKIASQYNRKRIDTKKKIMGKFIKPKLPDLSKVKNKAFKIFQERSKLRWVKLENGRMIIWLWDKEIFVPYDSNVQAGHCRPQKNYSQLAFDPQNVRPISK